MSDSPQDHDQDRDLHPSTSPYNTYVNQFTHVNEHMIANPSLEQPQRPSAEVVDNDGDSETTAAKARPGVSRPATLRAAMRLSSKSTKSTTTKKVQPKHNSAEKTIDINEHVSQKEPLKRKRTPDAETQATTTDLQTQKEKTTMSMKKTEQTKPTPNDNPINNDKIHLPAPQQEPPKTKTKRYLAPYVDPNADTGFIHPITGEKCTKEEEEEFIDQQEQLVAEFLQKALDEPDSFQDDGYDDFMNALMSNF